jgi:hypothetical protein
MLEQLAKKQAVKVAAQLRYAASMYRLDDVQAKIEGDDKGKTYIDTLTKAILSTLEPEKASKTLSLGGLFRRDVA